MKPNRFCGKVRRLFHVPDFANNRTMDRDQLTEDLPVGGQAVIEGVMMRVPGKVVTAVRKPDDEIVVQESDHVAWARRHRVLDIPILRGALAFFEMMIIGIRALNFSADVAMQSEQDSSRIDDSGNSFWKERLTLGATILFSLCLGIGLFFFLPLFAAKLSGAGSDALRFNVTAGLVRMALLLLYLWSISRWKDIQRVFQYHGAEHKSIFAHEAGRKLTVAAAREFGRLHPRCGTSFLLIVVLLSIFVFALADSTYAVLLGRQELLQRFATHLIFLPTIAGLSFELLKFSGRKRNHPITRFLIAPGLWLQRITTREPNDDQLEVALVALRHALGEPSPVEYKLVR